MAAPPSNLSDSPQAEFLTLLDQLPRMQHGKLIQQVLETLLRMIGREADRLDWKILN